MDSIPETPVQILNDPYTWHWAEYMAAAQTYGARYGALSVYALAYCRKTRPEDRG